MVARLGPPVVILSSIAARQDTDGARDTGALLRDARTLGACALLRIKTMSLPARPMPAGIPA
jgi:hypothetical protein